MDDYHVCFTVTHPLTHSGDATDYVLDIEGTLETANGGPSQNIVGWISARLVQAGRALDDQVPLLEVCDSIDQDLYDYASAVYDFREQGIRASISDGCVGSDILIVESISIVPAHRRKGLGLLGVQRTIDTFGYGCAGVVLRPFPFQFSSHAKQPSPGEAQSEQRLALDSFPADKSVALKALRKYWRRLGFERIGRTEFFFLDLQSTRPTQDEVLAAPRKASDRALRGNRS